MPAASTPIDDVAAALGRQLRRNSHGWRFEPVGGGSINRAYRINASDERLFVKLNAAERKDMFAAEAEGLRVIAQAGVLRVPRVIAQGCVRGTAYIALEWLDLEPVGARTERLLGHQLALLHRVTSTRYGWTRDNTIGATPQLNTQCDDWAVFFGERRMAYQLALARRNGLRAEIAAMLQALLAGLPALLAGHAPEPALLHGDLWGGNCGALPDATPVVFDPAVYFGDRETDLAMTRLFGGFGPAFYSAYMAELPLPPGWEQRADLYNLYHLLNHFNLFGATYLEPIRAAAARILRELN